MKHPFLIKGAEDRIIDDAAENERKLLTPGELIYKDVDYAKLTGEQLVKSSGKFVLLSKLLPKLHSGGHKVLIFSQMVRVLDLLQELLQLNHYRYERLDGTTSASARTAAVDRFKRESFKRFVMLLSTRAGGLGLNLTAADTVIIFDSDWNPQVSDHMICVKLCPAYLFHANKFILFVHCRTISRQWLERIESVKLGPSVSTVYLPQRRMRCICFTARVLNWDWIGLY